MIAVSGIDHTIKIFSPDQQSQYDARNGINIGASATGSSGHSSVFMSRPRAWRSHPAPPTTTNGDDTKTGHFESEVEDADTDTDDTNPRNGGLASRKRMHESYQIISQNDAERQGGMRDAYITVRGPSFPVKLAQMEFAAWLSLWGPGEDQAGFFGNRSLRSLNQD